MRILFDSKKAEFKTPFGCVAPGQTVTLHLHIPTAVSAWKVEIVLCYEDGSPARYHEMYRIEQRGAYDIYEGDFSLFAPGLHFYYFQIHAPHGMFRLFKQGDDTNMEEGGLWQISCISPDFTTPDWAKGAIIYQIFPDRFHRSGKCNLTGKLRPFVSGKDVILTLIGMIGVDGARYQSIEFSGEGVKNLTIYDRLTICNMAIEAGGKNGIFPVDDVTRAYVEGRVDRPWTAFEADPDAEYERVIDIDLGKVDCTVAWPHLPENAHSAREGSDIAIDQIVIGSCTNGQLPDMAAAAAILKGHHLAPNVRGIIIPATQEVYRACMHEGYTDIFLDAGCIVSTPTCGPCLGGYMGILAAGERCVSTTNRNFVGRMGHVDSEVYLASPAVAAASGITGHISHPEEVMNK